MCVRERNSEWETQMFNKIDGTNVIINQNTNLIIITEISISISFVCFVCTYTNRKHAVTAESELSNGEKLFEMNWKLLMLTEKEKERERAQNRLTKCVFRVPNNEQWNAENIEQMRKCLVFIYLFVSFFGCWKIDMKIWKNELYFVEMKQRLSNKIRWNNFFME